MQVQAGGDSIDSGHGPRSRLLTLVLSLLVISCATGGDEWREKDFVVMPAGGDTWWVSYEGQMMSRERARDYLLYHTARLVLDKGGAYFTFEESKPATISTERGRPASEQPSPADPVAGPFIPSPQELGDLSQVAVVEIVDKSGPGVFVASTLVEELSKKYSVREDG